jgi:hypothetical protein
MLKVFTFDHTPIEKLCYTFSTPDLVNWTGSGTLMDVAGILSELRLELQQVEQEIFRLERSERPNTQTAERGTDQKRPSFCFGVPKRTSVSRPHMGVTPTVFLRRQRSRPSGES